MARLTAVAEPRPGGLSKAEISAAKREVSEHLKGHSEGQLQCRSMRHAWRQSHSFRLISPASRRELPYLIMEFECERGCGVTRSNTLTVKRISGGSYEIVERFPSVYSYPDGYQMKGIPREARSQDDIWSEVIRRQLSTIQVEQLSEDA